MFDPRKFLKLDFLNAISFFPWTGSGDDYRALSPASGLKRNPLVRVGKRENRLLFTSFLFSRFSFAVTLTRCRMVEKKAEKNFRRNKQTNVCKQAECEIIAV